MRSLVTQTVTVTTTYVHIPTPADFRPATIDNLDLTIVHRGSRPSLSTASSTTPWAANSSG